MNSTRPRSAILEFVPHAIGLLLFGIFFEAVSSAATSRLPRSVFFESSFTLALARQNASVLAISILSFVFIVWLFSPAGRGRLSWKEIDSIGGLRWPTFLIAMTLAWAYAGHQYNYYLDQSHVWDRWLAIGLLVATLRSPLLIPVFILEILLSRAQFDHPLSSATPIADELPLRLLAIVAGGALWNVFLDGLRALRSGPWRSNFDRIFASARIDTRALIYSILCLIGFGYVLAGLGKIAIGRGLTDWISSSHMENLFVASYLNGWLSQLSEIRALELANIVRLLQLPIAITTLIIELAIAFILLRQRGTLLILAVVCAMHLGIVLLSGIIFWKWLGVDLFVLGWLWLRRNDPQIARLYSRSSFIASLLIIAGAVVLISGNRFAWWNTKWTMVYEIEAQDESGKTYVVNHSDFKPYTLFDLYKPDGRKYHTNVYGMTQNGRLRDFLEYSNPVILEKFATSSAKVGDGPFIERGKGKRAFSDFMTRYFMNRNQSPGRSVLPFVFPAPALHNRYLSVSNLYDDQAPIVEVQLRFKEIYYSGSALKEMRNQIVYTIPIPH